MFLLFLDRSFLVYHSHFLEKSVLLVMSSSPIPSGSAKRFQSSAVIWLLPVKLGRSCCLTFSRFFFNFHSLKGFRSCSGYEDKFFFAFLFCSRSARFVVTFLTNLETFFVRVVTFSISLSMYFLHPDGISITDPRTDSETISL